MKLQNVLQTLALTLVISMGLPGLVHAEVGITDTEIHIGSSLPLEGNLSYLGTQTMHGAMAYIKHINESGGIHNRTIKVTTYNDSYDPATCEKNTKTLINQDKVFALSSYVGTATSAKIVPVIEEAKVPLIGIFTGAEFLREPVKKYVFNIRSSYYEETAGIIDNFWNELGLRKIAVLYQNDAFGEAGLKG
ncbi:MAG: ABC transporter substrate-binding protein, partial [Bacteroidetes bacterium]|nr:ABC transporter substrate-binding protein [Bacteroidota bacterium]